MKKGLRILILMVLFGSLGLQGCKGSPANTEIPSDESSAAVENAEDAQTSEQANEENSEEIPESIESENTAGGTLVYAINFEPDTFDPQKTSSAASNNVLANIGASLIWLSEDGQYYPYLAESWTVSEDALSWTFKLREDVLFHNGTPLTAHDYAWTFNRAIDPETASPVAGVLLGDVNSILALDDFTLQINLNAPNFSLLFGLSSIGYVQPLSQQYFEEVGEDKFATNPIGVGPYRFKEWQTGEKIILERNPDFNWAPSCFESSGPLSIETLEYRILSEYSVTLAGLEAEEIDFSDLEPRDINRFLETGSFSVFEVPFQGINPFVLMNLEKAPFDDIRVRKAINQAIDREIIKSIAYQDGAAIQYGPISDSVAGYWAGVEEIGYDLDTQAALDYLQDAGFSLNTEGVMEKDGEPLKLELKVGQDDTWIKVAQLIQEQLKQIGIEIEITQIEKNTLMGICASGDYSLAIMGYGYGEADLMFYMFHSSMIGALNFSRIANPELDELLPKTRTEINPEARQEIVNQIQQIIVEEAYVVPLVTPLTYSVINNRIQGAHLNSKTIILELFEASIVEP